MSEQNELILPPGRSLDAVSADEHLLYVQNALAGAIADQDEGLVFPVPERLAGRFGFSRMTVWRLRSTLVQTGHLVQLGHIYVTAHPRHCTAPNQGDGEQS